MIVSTIEINKEEAISCKAIAKKKLKEKDIAEAKRYALKVEMLFPSLDDLSQLLKVINFYDGYEKKTNGEVNWYEILGVDPLADMETLRKAHERMALALHPDKNKSLGAEEAFKLLFQAQCVLFDKGNKLVYDMKLNLRVNTRVSVGNPPFPADIYTFGNFKNCSSSATNMTASGKDQNVPVCPTNPATTTGSRYNPPPLWPSYQVHMTPEAAAIFYRDYVGNHQNPPIIAPSFQNFPTQRIPGSQTPTRHHQHAPSSSGNSQPIPSPPASRPETFWTLCHKCWMLYEFMKIYLDQTLMCPNCREPFLAKQESASSSGRIRSSQFPRSFHHQKPGWLAAAGSSKRGCQEAVARTISFGNLKGSIGDERVTPAT